MTLLTALAPRSVNYQDVALQQQKKQPQPSTVHHTSLNLSDSLALQAWDAVALLRAYPDMMPISAHEVLCKTHVKPIPPKLFQAFGRFLRVRRPFQKERRKHFREYLVAVDPTGERMMPVGTLDKHQATLALEVAHAKCKEYRAMPWDGALGSWKPQIKPAIRALYDRPDKLMKSEEIASRLGIDAPTMRNRLLYLVRTGYLAPRRDHPLIDTLFLAGMKSFVSEAH